VHYCSRTHQREHWKSHKLVCGAAHNSEARSSEPGAEGAAEAENRVLRAHLFPEYSLVVEAEELDRCEDEARAAMDKANIWEDAGELVEIVMAEFVEFPLTAVYI
jgi:hypothetical protein